MPLTPKEMIKHLKRNGFKEVSQNGSHVKLKNYKTGKQVILKAAGLKERYLE